MGGFGKSRSGSGNPFSKGKKREERQDITRRRISSLLISQKDFSSPQKKSHWTSVFNFEEEYTGPPEADFEPQASDQLNFSIRRLQRK